MTRAKPSFDAEVASLLTFSGDALCRDYDPKMFDAYDLPVRSNSDRAARDAHNEAAREVCLSCPVMMQCLEHAFLYEKTDAIYGGMTDEERQEWAEKATAA